LRLTQEPSPLKNCPFCALVGAGIYPAVPFAESVAPFQAVHVLLKAFAGNNFQVGVIVPVPPDTNVNTYSVDCVAIVPPPVVNFGTYPA
jgi:hypothetical protein